MRWKPENELPDERVTRKVYQKKRVEQLWEQICEKQREIRSLEMELARTDPDELAKECDEKVTG